MIRSSLLLALFLYQGAFAQMQTDILFKDSNSLKVTPIVHGTLVLEWADEVIYVDPYGGAEKFEGLPLPTLVLITDVHGDHLNKATLNALDLSKAKIYAPQAVYDMLDENHQEQSIVIANDQQKEFNALTIGALPMYNLPDDETARHTKGRGNGYTIHYDNKTVYISGDTEDIPEMRSLKNIDVAFVCMNLPYTMDIEQAADAVNDFKPAIVYPFHYRGKGGLSDVDKFKELVEASNATTEVRLRNWYSE